MKLKLFIVFALFNAVISIKASAQDDPQYEWEQVQPVNEWLMKVYAQGLDTVYVLGLNGLIAQSTDRALTWNKQYPVTTQLNDIIFCNHTTGFAVGNNGTILSTTDAGVNWTQVTSGVTKKIYAIAATGLDNIWAVGDSGLVIQSKDAGITWTAIKLAPDSINLFDIKFSDSVGYITGSHNKVLKTTNGGTDWVNNDIDLKIHSAFFLNNQFSIHSLFFTHNRVYAMMSNDYYHGSGKGLPISSEINATNSWTEIKDIYGGSIYAGSIYFINDSLGYFGAYDWTDGNDFKIWIYKTTDGGQNWEEIIINNYYVGQISTFSNFSFNSDCSSGYFLCGQILYRNSNPFGFNSGLNDIKSDLQTLQVKQHGEELQVCSLSKTITDIEIYSVTGAKICQKKNNVVNVQQIPSGVYFICARYTDNSKSNLVKWIRR